MSSSASTTPSPLLPAAYSSPPPSYSDISLPASSYPSPDLASSRSSPKSQPHIPRPRNAFIIFRSHYYMRAKATQTGINQNSLSCAAASAWKALSDDEKRPYRRQAEEEKLTHYRKHPNYVYTPVNKAVKRAQKKARLTACRRPPAQKLRSSLTRRVAARSGDAGSYSIFPPSWHASPSIDAFVPLEDIPSLDLTPISKNDEADCSLRPPFYDRVDPQFGFRPDLGTSFLPPMPSSGDESKTLLARLPTTVLTTTDTAYPNWVYNDLVPDAGIHAGWNPIQATLDAYGDGYDELSAYDIMDTNSLAEGAHRIFSQDGVWTGL